MSEQEIVVLIERSKRVKMSAVEIEQQRRSFAYGNANIENSDVTKEIIDVAADELAQRRPDSK